MALRNLKVLDFSTLLPGPYASLMLADMGADVIKISDKNRADLVLDKEPFIEGTGMSANQAWINRNKDTMFLDLKKPESVEIVKKLIVEEGYDIILEQFRAGVMDRLGLGYDELKKICPGLIYCSLTGYGQTGPYSSRAGHDINFLSLSGTMSHSGKKEGGPSLLSIQVGDLAIGSFHSIIGILASVEHRHNTGEGQRIDVAMLDGLISFNSLDGCGFLVDGKLPEREAGLLNGGTFYDFYETKDGEFLSVGSLEPKFWEGFCTALGKSEWIAEGVKPADIDARKAEARQIIKGKTRKEWEAIFEPLDCCVEPILNLREALLENEHIKERELITAIDVQGKEVKQYAMPIHFSKTKPVYAHSGKELGVDTEKIIERLGYTKEQYQELQEKGVFG
ncbi:MAG: CaiB/BaiF CoA-transferase family protein [Bacillota bacterium]|nr:CaiB/BaiF CoA-transferase family protein [Bacillota bacterium]